MVHGGGASESRDAVQHTIDAAADELHALSLEVHAHPELNFAEERAHGLLTDYLERHGFAVQRGAYGMPTAFEARAGSGDPVVAVLCEYDALPGIGHACGHNLIAVAGVAAGLGAAVALPAGQGTVVVLGSPAEEGGGGKIELIDRGAFKALAAAMMAHPAPRDGIWPSINALQTLEVEYHGRHAHAAVQPWDGRNALDAMILAYNGVSALRQQLPPDARVHGVITHGGDKPNIIPHRTAAEFYVRAAHEASLDDLKARVLACFQGAAEATGCTLQHRWVGPIYSHLTTNDPLAEAYVRNAERLGKRLPSREMSFSGGSTDMGNVSHVVPSIHPMYGIATEAGNHTPEFTVAAATPEAHRETMTAAKAMALTLVDLCRDPALLDQVRARFASDHAG